jgi:hypothetical protein
MPGDFRHAIFEKPCRTVQVLTLSVGPWYRKSTDDMASPVQAPVPERGFGSYIDLFTRIMTAMLVLIYGIGFVILAVYEAHYGIVQFSR